MKRIDLNIELKLNKINENNSVLRWFDHIQSLDGNLLSKHILSGKCVGKQPAGERRKSGSSH